MRTLLALLLCACSIQAQTVLRSGSFHSIITPSGPPVGGGAAPGDGYEANLYAYYTCEDASGQSTDSTSAHRNLTQSHAPCSSSDYHATGFIGHGFEVGGYCGINTGLLFDGGDDFAFFGKSFTIRFWAKTSADANEDNFLNADGGPWFINYGPSGGTATDGRIEFDVQSDTTDYRLNSSSAINDGSWHRVICWFNASTFEEGIQIDNGTASTATAVALFDNTGTTLSLGQPTFNVVTPPSASFLIDEVAIWRDYVLTSGDRIFDWNSGAGQTFPLP